MHVNCQKLYLRGEVNLSGKSFKILSLAKSATGPNNTTGLINPGCRSTTLS